ncbi:hypothetical protein BIV18_08300 [Peptoniphilus porci]|uniref:Uncharacterized protein n=1 Tax=Peptoniphilus porci TaxID=2652280 RepID=A0A1U7M1K1_9FIRM|nr:hypothetical protein BIV18_08300 [Peptoniphilus porci]
MKLIKRELIRIFFILGIQILCGYIFFHFFKKSFNLREFFTNYAMIIFWIVYFVVVIIINILKMKNRIE